MKANHTFLRTLVQLSHVRNPHRPICTGPRPDNGFPSFPYDVSSSWSLFDDTFSEHIKVVQHVLPPTPTASMSRSKMNVAQLAMEVEGVAGVVYHALHSAGGTPDAKTGPGILTRIWKDFQAQGPYEMRFKRNLLTKVSRRREFQIPFNTSVCFENRQS